MCPLELFCHCSRQILINLYCIYSHSSRLRAWQRSMSAKSQQFLFGFGGRAGETKTMLGSCQFT